MREMIYRILSLEVPKVEDRLKFSLQTDVLTDLFPSHVLIVFE